MKRPPNITFIAFILLLGLAACQPPNAVTPVAVPTATVPAIPTPGTPTPGKATVTGRALALDTGAPFVNMVIRLAPVLHLDSNPNDDTFVLDNGNSPAAITNSQGYFVLANVDPKEYVVIVGDVDTSYAVATVQPDKAKVWKLTADQVTDVGEIRVVLK
jgi:hypothetical protein